MTTDLLGALIATFSILVFVLIMAAREGAKIDRERHSNAIK